MTKMSDLIVQDNFYCCSSNKDNYRGFECLVSLTSSKLSIEPVGEGKKKSITIKIDDVVGCLCMKNKVNSREERGRFPNEGAISTFLSIYFYSLTKTFTKSLTRKRETVLLRYCKHTTFPENSEVIAKWQSAIFSLIQSYEIVDHGLVMDRETPEKSASSPKLLIFVNPNSGPGFAVKNFNRRVRPLLGEANISYDLVVTSHRFQCQKMIEEMPDLTKYAGLVAVSGDGLLFEIYNGLIARNDWEQLISFPVGIIPQGSGNGLARSLAHFNGEPYVEDPLLISALNIVKMRKKKMDLCLVNATNNPKMCCFLSVSWGLLSDIDIESERLRMIGEARFTVWAVARVLRLRTYKATISYLPVGKHTDSDLVPLPPLSEPLPDNQGWVTISGEIVCFFASIIPYIGTDLCIAPKSELTDGIMYLLIIKAPVTKVQIAQFLLKMEDGSHAELPWLTFVAAKAFRLVPDMEASQQSYLNIDGEKFDSQPVQVQVLPGKGRVFTR